MGATIFFDPQSKNNREFKGNSLLALPDSYTVVDLETTGLDPSCDDIIEFGALRVENETVFNQFSTLINPGHSISSFITELTGITNEMLLNAPTITDVIQDFLNFVGDSIVIGHNVNFDVNFIYDTSMAILQKPFRNDFIDTMRLSRRLFKNERHHRLCDLIERFNISNTVEHRALADVEQTHCCYLYMKQYIKEHKIDIKTLYPTKKKYHLSLKDIKPTKEFDETSPFYHKFFSFTGKLERMTRKEAAQIVVNLGGRCNDSVNKMTNYLVIGNNDYCSTLKDGKSSKQKRAEQLKLVGYDIEIITENTFYDMIDEYTCIH